MKKSLSVFVALMAAVTSWGGNDSIPFASTIPILPDDSRETIIAKAAHVVPNDRQAKAMENEFIAFIHFGPNTFSGREWGTGMEDPTLFNPPQADADQWVKTMKDAGMKMVIITVKHHDGYVLWQSRYTDHGIMQSPFMDGKGDVFRELSEACAKYGMKLGVYLSPADLYQIESPDGLYGNLSQKTLRTIPREVEGRPFENQTKFQFVIDDYNEYFLNQLFELLTEYGPIYEVWFDGATPKEKGGQTYDYHAWLELVHTLAPEAVIFGRDDVRWCGNEAGWTRDTEWNVVPYTVNPDSLQGFEHSQTEDIGSLAMLEKANFLHYEYPETDTSIRDGWFYRDDDRQAVRSADDVFDIYERAVGGNSTLLLNTPPNKEGRFSDRDVATLTEVGKRIRDTYTTNLIAGWNAPAELLDTDWYTGIPVESEVILTSDVPATFNRIVLQEAVATNGERIAEHAVDAWIDGQWKEVAHATNVGYKRILRFPDVTTDSIRIRIIDSRLTPQLSTVGAYYYNARPPQLESSRTIDGMVSIFPKKSEFGWKNGVKDAIENLSKGVVIKYTTDGSEPNDNSPVYTAPFKLDKGTVKAISQLKGENGPVMTQKFGIVKEGWKVIDTPSMNDRFKASNAIDAKNNTFWLSDSVNHTFTVDLGRMEKISGLMYTPQSAFYGEGMIAKAKVEVSKDGKKWQNVGVFEFGNLINDPSTRTFEFTKPVETKYIRIVPEEIAGKSKLAAIAELDLF